MKKLFVLVLLTTFLVACSGGKSTKIKNITKMTKYEIAKVSDSLTIEQFNKLGEAIMKCQMNAEDEVCNKTIKEVIK